jgi:hypothetical protein
VRLAYSSSAVGMSATAVAAFLVAGILAGTEAVSWPVAIAFSVFMLVQIQARLLLIAAYHRQDPPDHEWRVWSRRFTAGVVVGSFGLGVFSWVLFAAQRFDMQLLVLLYLCAVASGAITAYGALRPAIYFSILPMLLSTMWMMMRNDWVHWMIAGMLIVWLLAVTNQARRYGAHFEETVRLLYQNQELVERLRQEKRQSP